MASETPKWEPTKREQHPTIEQVNEAIAKAFDGNRIALNNGDVKSEEKTLAPKLIGEIQGMVEKSTSWDAFGKEMVIYRSMVRRVYLDGMSEANANYVMRLIDDAVSSDYRIRTFIKDKEDPTPSSGNS